MSDRNASIRALFVLLLLLNGSRVVAQRTHWLMNDTTHDEYPVHFGFSLGFNTMDCAIEGDAQLNVLHYGFSIQAVGNFRLCNLLDFRLLPGISFGDRYIDYLNKEMKMRISYVDVPALLKFKSRRYNNIRPFLTAGGSMRYLLNKVMIDLGGNADPNHKYDLLLRRFEPYLDIGSGIDFYLPYFKFSVEFRGSWGMQNSVRYAVPATGIRTMRPSVYSLVFCFE